MKKSLLFLSIFALVASIAVAQDDAKLSLTLREGNGKMVYHLYDAQNNLSRTYELLALESGEQKANYQYFYNYVDGQLAEYYYIQYKDMGVWTDPMQHTVYTYDEQGKLIREENLYTARVKDYVYDEQGRLYSIKDSKHTADTHKVYSLTVYSQYDENNNPVRVDFNDSLYVSSSYYTLYAYDQKGNNIEKSSYRAINDDPDTKFLYAYDDNGIVVSSTKFYGYDGVFVENSLETRTHKGNNVYTFQSFNYVEDEKRWAPYQTYTEYYNTMNGAYAPANLVAQNVTTADLPNAIELTCDLPEVVVPGAQYLIWCDGEVLDTVAAVDNQIKYNASNLGNGAHELLVQPYDHEAKVYYNASNAAQVSFITELPTITNLRYKETTKGSFVNEGSSIPAYWVHFEWDAPETSLEVLGYNIYQDGWAVPYTFTTNTCDSAYVYREKNFDSPDQQKAITIEVSVEYDLGESERVAEVFPVERVDNGIDGVVVESAYVAGNYLVVPQAADVKIYNAAGVMVVNRRGVTRIDLATIPVGVYVATIKAGNCVQKVKFTR